jgi:peptidoglycan/LPS O-acetylase OafA/YrhL
MQTHIRIREIDGMRAIGVLLVLIFHAKWPILWIDTGGTVGVDIFFVVSGFVITRTLLKEWGQTGALKVRKFYLRRFIRLTPPLITVVLVTVPIGLVIFNNPSLLLFNALGAITYLSPVFTGLLDIESLGYYHTWTLALEEYFYIVFPWIFIVFSKKISRALFAKLLFFVSLSTSVAIAFFVAILGGDDGTQTFGLLSYLRVAGIGLGASLALNETLMEKLFERIPPWVMNVFGSALFLSSLALSQEESMMGVSWLFADLSALIIILSILKSRESYVPKILGSKLMVFIGGISYELYLWHAVLLELTIFATKWSASICALFVYPLSFGLAWLTKTGWSKHQIKFSKRVAGSSND